MQRHVFFCEITPGTQPNAYIFAPDKSGMPNVKDADTDHAMSKQALQQNSVQHKEQASAWVTEYLLGAEGVHKV